MPLIPPKPQPPKKETLAIRLEVATLDHLKRYAAFLGTRDLSHVVTGSLEKVFNADKEYKSWLKDHPHSAIETRVRKNGGPDPHPSSTRLSGAAAPAAVDAVQAKA